MSLTEKTLEVNVTHELLTLGDGIGRLIGEALGSQWVGEVEREVRRNCGGNFGPPYALGLTLRDEHRDGWDIQLALPPGPLPARAFFMQFKLGSPCGYSTDPNSAFWGSRTDRKPHLLFGINNNTRRNQHIVLRGLADDVGGHDSVLYALPRVPDVQAFHEQLGQLAVHTTWVTVRRLDALAQPPIVEGAEHHLAVDYEGVPRELRSELVRLDDASEVDVSADVVAEFLRLRAAKMIVAWMRAMDEVAPDALPRVDWNEILDRHLLFVAHHFGSVDGLPEHLRENREEWDWVIARSNEVDISVRAVSEAVSDATISVSRARRERVVSRTGQELAELAGLVAGRRTVDPNALVPRARYSTEIGENVTLRVPSRVQGAELTTSDSMTRSFLSASCQIV